MRVSVAALLLSATAASAAGYHCERLMSAGLGAKASFMPSVMGDFTLDGHGDYGHVRGGGVVAIDVKGIYRFASGAMKGTVGRLRKDAKGREYFHIDKSITDPPQDAPRELDLVCYRT